MYIRGCIFTLLLLYIWKIFFMYEGKLVVVLYNVQNIIAYCNSKLNMIHVSLCEYNFWSSWPKVVQALIWGLGLRENPYRTWHRKVPFVGIKACYFMRILLVMVSDYCSKGWIFVPTSGKPGKSRVWGWSKSWTGVKLRDYFTILILYDPKCWTVARTMKWTSVRT